MGLFSKKKTYWEMNNEELEQEAAKHHVQEYGVMSTDPQFGNVGRTGISRKSIIDQLISKDNHLNSRVASIAMWVSIAMALVNLGITILNAMSKNGAGINPS